MPDITFVRGYGFPRGSAMDYAGYGQGPGGGAFGHYSAGRRGADGVWKSPDGCPMDSVRVGMRCVPFAQVSGGADLSMGDCGCGCNGAVGGCGGGTKSVAGFGRFSGPVRGRSILSNQVPTLAPPGTYATIPALDGYNETQGSMELDPLPITVQAGGAQVLPTLDVATGKWYDDQNREVDPSTGALVPQAGGGAGLAVLGLGLLAAALFLR